MGQVKSIKSVYLLLNMERTTVVDLFTLLDLPHLLFISPALFDWDRRTGDPFHNFISWQDQRAADLVTSWNRSCTLKVSLWVLL